MKSIFNLNYLVAITCLVILGSCSEDKDPAKTDAEIIGSGIAWKLSAATSNNVSVISLIDLCLRDNLVTFNYETPLSIGVVDAGATKCDPTEPQTADFTWSYNETTKILTVDTNIIDVPGAQGSLMVESVTNTELVLSQNISFSGLTQKVILTLVH
ncbi:hypothetical protein LV84_02875 [Algoriphagus ratkowskyi]|uniref:Lipocalin-like protein n=1 Tax=Algoriphagus ratkowskyi TaxID=57028 RepID=A0A2W7R3H5_9BACT|nr:hypothetical protein [Algoriphagus ratkowskyi]PZX54721.1 hypothetical protein LV84_02875 [Algoriphagus ratkowskyi]TXD77029.1 hypothetical protein ESW18_14580 [Algoriphagus ratkowskyi]